MFPDILAGATANGVKIIAELNLQNNALKHDSWGLLYELLSSTAVFATVEKVPPSAGNGNAEQIVVKARRNGETIHCLTLTDKGVKGKIGEKEEEVFFEFGKFSELVGMLWTA